MNFPKIIYKKTSFKFPEKLKNKNLQTLVKIPFGSTPRQCLNPLEKP